MTFVKEGSWVQKFTLSFGKRPHKPDWMTQETYDSYPDQMTVREFKIKGEVYVTTFQDHKKYNKVALANHYKQRWHIEINFNSLKTIMSMDHLRSKTPDMVHKEIAVHFLAYNLIRTLIAEACRNTERLPIQREFDITQPFSRLYFMPREGFFSCKQ